jgi:2-oxoglutarate dehydrogenase complex dehydrogenase (E1) component-like enzyme
MGHKHSEISYAGRGINASPSTGFGSVHKQQLANLLEKALV